MEVCEPKVLSTPITVSITASQSAKKIPITIEKKVAERLSLSQIAQQMEESHVIIHKLFLTFSFFKTERPSSKFNF